MPGSDSDHAIDPDNSVCIGTLLANVPAEAQLETQLLIAHALHWSRAKVLAFSETVIADEVARGLLDQLERLQQGEPYSYIVGSREFFGLEFAVNPNVLVPRPETELLVELAIERAPQNARVVDLGTGSGAIAVSLKHARPDLVVTATDASAEALEVASRNANRHNCDVEFQQSDWFKDLKGNYDVVISNPPYIRANDPHLPALGHEPTSALVAADNGMADIRTIVAGALGALPTGGQLLIEHGFDQAADVAAAFSSNGFAKIESHKDLAGLPRATSGLLN